MSDWGQVKPHLMLQTKFKKNTFLVPSNQQANRLEPVRGPVGRTASQVLAPAAQAVGTLTRGARSLSGPPWTFFSNRRLLWASQQERKPPGRLGSVENAGLDLTLKPDGILIQGGLQISHSVSRNIRACSPFSGGDTAPMLSMDRLRFRLPFHVCRRLTHRTKTQWFLDYVKS